MLPKQIEHIHEFESPNVTVRYSLHIKPMRFAWDDPAFGNGRPKRRPSIDEAQAISQAKAPSEAARAAVAGAMPSTLLEGDHHEQMAGWWFSWNMTG